jgi:PDZ domain-containing protein
LWLPAPAYKALTTTPSLTNAGTIDAAGNVGPIGGVSLKMYSAQAAGATFFLSPADNCDEVVGNVPSGIQVFSVATITEAVTAVTTAASGDAAAMAKLPTCT